MRECVERHTERGEIEMEDDSVKESVWRDREKIEGGKSVTECVERYRERFGGDRNGGRKRERESVCGEIDRRRKNA